MPPVKRDDSEDSPITTNQILRWGGLSFTAVSLLASAIMYASNARQDVQLIRKDVDNHTTAISKIEQKQERNDQAIQEMQRKLDVAVTILERLDKKTNEVASK